MAADATQSTLAEPVPAFLHAFRTGTLTEAQPQAFAEQDPIDIKFQILELTALVAAKRSPHAPSSTLVPFVRATRQIIRHFHSSKLTSVIVPSSEGEGMDTPIQPVTGRMPRLRWMIAVVSRGLAV